MNSQLQKQIFVGGLLGLLVVALTFFMLGGKRDDLKALAAANDQLQKDVDKGTLLKANYERLKVEVAQQEQRIEDLIKIMPTDQDRGNIPYAIKKLADTAGIDLTSFLISSKTEDQPKKTDYYTEYPIVFQFRITYHTLGQFASLLSGYEKIINMSDMQIERPKASDPRSPYTANLTCKISAFVYNPAPPVAAAAPKAGAAPKAAGKAEGD